MFDPGAPMLDGYTVQGAFRTAVDGFHKQQAPSGLCTPQVSRLLEVMRRTIEDPRVRQVAQEKVNETQS